MVKHKTTFGFRAKRFVASLLALLTLGHITADKVDKA